LISEFQHKDKVLFSAKSKAKVLAEPFIKKSKDGYYQSISDFVTHRLGKEFLDYAVDPFVAGVYAGNPGELSVKSAFPKLYELEEKYGSLIIGTIKSLRQRKGETEKSKQNGKMISFKEGMQTLPNAIAKNLNDKIIFDAEVISIEKRNGGYIVKFSNKGNIKSIYCDILISTLPAFAASNLFRSFDENVSKHLNQIYYPPVFVLYLAYFKKDIRQTLDGFGFLIPSKEKKSFLGAIWNSVIFPERIDNDKAVFTLFIGGARNPEIINLDKEDLISKVRKEFEQLMKINGEPIFSSNKFWPNAIPQYNIGYIKHENYFDEFEKKNRGIILSGNYRRGISLGDCIKNSAKIAEAVFAM
ncbi:MAG: protoporphyrinogen oxidase, partial [Ignavibacteriaceae bacterium]